MAAEIYTALERFLLFRRLYPFEKEIPSFALVSEALKHDEILLSSDSFDATRLEPGALQNLYLQTLKDEVKAQIRGDQNDQSSQDTRKRKLSNPRLETLEEAVQYAHLLPELVDRLYFNYQRAAVDAIRDEEYHFHSQQGKGGDKDKKEREIRHDILESNPRPTSHGVPSIQTLLLHEEEKAAQDSKGRRPSYSNGPNGSPYQELSQPLLNGTPLAASSSLGQEARVSSNDPRYVQSNGPTHLPPPHYPPQPYSLPPPGSEAHGRRSSQPLPSPSPRMSQVTIPPPERSSASPIILPPVSGMLRSQGAPTGPVEPLGEAGQPYRPSPNMSPRPGQPTLTRPHNNHIPTTRNYTHPNYSYHDSRQYPAYQTYSQQGYYPPYSGPISSMPQGSPYGTSPGYPSPGLTHPAQHPGYYPPQGYYNQSPISAPYSHQQPPRYAGHQTPKPDGPRQPLPLSHVQMPISSTKWKHVDLEKGAKPPGSPTRPLSREISPITPVNDGHDSLEQDPSSVQNPTARTQPDGGNLPHPERSATTRGRLSRGSGRAGHAGNAPASARDRTRSRSFTSNQEDLSTDAKVSTIPNIKPEPFIPSVNEDETSTMDESSRKPGRRRRGTVREDDPPATPRAIVKRKRGDSSLPLPSPVVNQSRESLQRTPEMKALRRPGYILATRNLQKISSTLMQTITAHKDAYLFLKPLTERDAPGYDKLVFRAQDLKAIKTALVAGSRAVAAIIEGAGEEIDHGAKSIWIPKTEEVVPPKGIVSSSQLEKELLRIFANAVMFNPELAENRGLGVAFQTRARTLEEHRSGEREDVEGEATRNEIGVARPVDGAVVEDTRKMCADVEEAFDAWRGIGKVDDAEARAAPVIGQPKDDVVDGIRENSRQEKTGTTEVAVDAGGENEKELSAEPKPKRRRRQM